MDAAGERRNVDRERELRLARLPEQLPVELHGDRARNRAPDRQDHLEGVRRAASAIRGALRADVRTPAAAPAADEAERRPALGPALVVALDRDLVAARLQLAGLHSDVELRCRRPRDLLAVEEDERLRQARRMDADPELEALRDAALIPRNARNHRRRLLRGNDRVVHGLRGLEAGLVPRLNREGMLAGTGRIDGESACDRSPTQGDVGGAVAIQALEVCGHALAELVVRAFGGSCDGDRGGPRLVGADVGPHAEGPWVALEVIGAVRGDLDALVDRRRARFLVEVSAAGVDEQG